MAALLLLQWNAQGMFGHGQELIKYIHDSKNTYHIICIQETWYNDHRTLKIPDYIELSRTRKEQQRGGCAIYIHEKTNYDNYSVDDELELQKVCIHLGKQKINIINFYNPCKKLEESTLEKILSYSNSQNYILVGDFNAHNKLWGSEKTDQNGKVIETVLDKNNSVILNDGSGTRIDTHSGKISHLDLTITSSSLANKCTWNTEGNSLGSDHFLITIKITLENNIPNRQDIENKENSWSFKNFDWTKFKSLCDIEFEDSIVNQDVNIFYDNYMNILVKIIKKIMPKKNTRKHNPTPWWTKECSVKIKERNKAKNKLKRSISLKNLQEFQKKKAEAQKTIRQSEQQYWTNFCLKLDRYTQETKLWSCIRRMNHLPSKSKNVPLLKVNDIILTEDIEKVEAFSECFNIIEKDKDRNNPNKQVETISPEEETFELAINDSFTIKELGKALVQNKATAPGHDKIPYEIYSNLTHTGKVLLLKLINTAWNTIELPKACKHAILIPISKPNKDPNNVNSYRPIALLPCFTKIIEKMINYRLQWFTEKNDILPPFISGFRQGRSAIDNIVVLENTIQKSINNKEHTIVVYLDIAQAYDAVNINGLLYKLNTNGIKGKMLKFLQQYLSERTYQVRINSTLSETKTLRKGLPQGSILSPILFNIMMYDIPTNPHVGIMTYADDIVIYFSSKNTKYIGKKIQEYLNELNDWFDKWGFKLSMSKTIPVLFTKTPKPYYPEIKLKDKPLNYSPTYKFLGVTFDSKLIWQPHIENITTRCKKKLNFLRCLSGTKWGSTTKSLLMVYRALIRSLLDYGCEAYDSASDTVKKSLDSIQYQALKICTGTCPLTSLSVLQALTGEEPLDLRRKMLANKFKLSVNRISKHPLLPQIRPCWQFEYLTNKKCNKPFGYRTMEAKVYDIELLTPIPLPPWIIHTPIISTELKEHINKSDSPHYMLQRTTELIRNKWKTELHVYTDGSLIPQKNIAAAAFWVPAFSYKQNKRLEHAASSMKTELAAIILALTWVEQLNLYTGAVIFSDSLSGLLAIKNEKKDNFVKEILTLITQLKYKNIDVHFEWIPAHCGLQHNEIVDYYAKLGLSKKIEIFNKPTFLEEKNYICQQINEEWNQRWQKTISPFKQIIPNVPAKYTLQLTRKEEKIIHRLRTGIMGLNEDLHILGIHENGHCNQCPELETVQHFLTSCPQHIIQRAMLITETKTLGPNRLMNLLRSPLPNTQRALARFVIRTNRFPQLC